MKIDPTVDCVFKAILGAHGNEVILIDFLNAVLQLEGERVVTSAEIRNPYNPKDFNEDKLSIVDVKVKDQLGRMFQIEIQLSIHQALPKRILYTWGEIYNDQLAEGQDYGELCPAISIWLLRANLFRESMAYHHHFCAMDPENQVLLHPDFSIHVLELSKWG